MAMFQGVKISFLKELNLIRFKNVQMVCSNRKIHSSKPREVQEANTTEPLTLNKLKNTHGKPENLDFDNYKLAYKSMTTKELTRALFVLRLSSVNLFVDNSLKIMHYSRKILGERIFNKVAKATFYGQFVGGDNEPSLMSCVDRNRKAGIGLMLAIPMEDDAEQSTDIETKCDENLQIMLESMALLDTLSDTKPMFQVKLTALVPGLLCAAVSKCVPEPSTEPEVVEHVAHALQENKTVNIKGLSKDETDQLQHGIRRIRTLLKAAEDKGMILLVDAEYTYLNPALNLFSLAMMLKCYTDRPLIYYTYQNYLKSTDHVLDRDIKFIKSHGVGFAAKLVRGAYLEKERHLAKKNAYEDPVHPTFEDTTKTYTNSLNKMLNNIARGPTKYAVVVATHNEDTVLYAVKRMEELGLQPSHGSVYFGQVYGMCDHISYTLGQNGYLIYKSIPYGTVSDTLPYLSRRALENRSVMDFRRERKLLVDAFRDRMSISSRIGNT